MIKTEREFKDGLLVVERMFDDATPTALSPVLKSLETVEAIEDAAAYSVIKSLSSVPKRYTLGPAYAANKIDVGKGVDKHIDFIQEEALEMCAWGYLAKGREIGMFHLDGTYGHAVVVESYIYRGPDWTIDDGAEGYVIKSGDWMLGAVWDDFGFDLVMKQLINGWSPQGKGIRTTPTPDELAVARLRSSRGSRG